MCHRFVLFEHCDSCEAIMRMDSWIRNCKSGVSDVGMIPNTSNGCLTGVVNTEIHEFPKEVCIECQGGARAYGLGSGAEADTDNDNGGVSLRQPQSYPFGSLSGGLFRNSSKANQDTILRGQPKQNQDRLFGSQLTKAGFYPFGAPSNTSGGLFRTQPMKTESHPFGVSSNASGDLFNNQSKQTGAGLFGTSTKTSGCLFDNQPKQTCGGLFQGSINEERPEALSHERLEQYSQNQGKRLEGMFGGRYKKGSGWYLPPSPVMLDDGDISKPAVTQKAKPSADKALESLVQEFRKTCDNIIDCLKEGYDSIEDSRNAESTEKTDAQHDSLDTAASTNTISSTGAELDPMEQIDAEYSTWFGGNDSALNAPTGRCPCPICTDVDSKVDI